MNENVHKFSFNIAYSYLHKKSLQHKFICILHNKIIMFLFLLAVKKPKYTAGVLFNK